MNYLLIAACGAAWLFQLAVGSDVQGLISGYGFTPSRVLAAIEGGQQEGALDVALTVLTSMFLHGGWFHVLGNLLYLRVFGDNIEDAFGHLPFLVFYLLSGVMGAAGQFFVEPTSSVPMVGASGAVAGVLGAYIVLYPRARVLTLFPVFIVLTFIEVPAFVFLGIWGLQQFLNGYLTIAVNVQGAGGIAWFAHIGGFSLGVVCGLIARVVGKKPNRSAKKRRAS